MHKRIAALSLCLLAAGCGKDSLAAHEDAAVISSLQFDEVPCRELLAQRNGLMQRYGLAETAKPTFTNSPTGLAPFIPDYRSRERQASEKAAGEIDAMNRSLVRRECIKEPQRG